MNSRRFGTGPRRWYLGAVPLLFSVWLACTGELETGSEQALEAAGTEVVDDAGVAHGVDVKRGRVISTIPGITDLFVRLGATDRLVGRTRYDTGAEVAHLPSIGGGLDPDLETLTVLDPDLVVMWTDTDARSMTARIGELGIETYAARVDGMDDFRRHAQQLGALTGLEGEVSDVLGDIDRTFDEIRDRVGDSERPSVLYVIAVDPPMVAGPGTFLDALVTISGGDNVFGDLEVAWPQVSLEAIVQRDPDAVVVSVQGGSYAPLHERGDGWSQIRAVQEGRVFQVDPSLFNRPGPGIGEAALTLAKLLHPNRFEPADAGSAGLEEGN